MPAVEWQTDSLDVTAYLERIDYTGSLEPAEATLVGLHRAHLDTIAFENLDIVFGRGISVELDRIQNKLVADRRGGYCYEHGLLFAAVLERLGYRVERLLARVGHNPQRPHARTHLALHVHSCEGSWLADVGFGNGLLEPIRWPQAGAVNSVQQGGWNYRLAVDTDGRYTLHQTNQAAGEWATLYSFVRDPQHVSDIIVANHFTSTHPSSPFVGQNVVMRREPHLSRRLIGRQLHLTYSDGTQVQHELSDTEVLDVLRRDFGLCLTSEDATALLAALPTS